MNTIVAIKTFSTAKTMSTWELKDFARHKKLETTQRYVHVSADELRQKGNQVMPIAMNIAVQTA